MHIFHLHRKASKPQPFVESNFSCRRGDLTIRGTEYRPEGSDLPVAIISHGFMANQNTVRHYARMLARRGYCSYCFDFCGGCLSRGKSDGKTTEMSVLTEIQDLMAVISHAKSLSYTGDHLLLMGCSQGGLVSALTAAKYPDQVTGLVLFYPALCIPDDARAGKMLFARFDPKNIPEILRCGPMKLGRCYPSAVLDMDPFQDISPYHGPVLIVHGTKDRIVPVRYSEQARKSYSNAMLHLIEGGTHGFRKEHDAAAIKHLKEYIAQLR